jgi:transposase
MADFLKEVETAPYPSSHSAASPPPLRYIGLDIHKRYLVACGVDADKQLVYGPKKVDNAQLDGWLRRDLLSTDAVVLEMTTNTWQMVDLLTPSVGSVTVVHPPHVHLITRARVMNDQRAAVGLAKLHAAGLLPGVWVPPKEVRDLRAIVAQRQKMTRLVSQAKNRLQSLLHRAQIVPPEGVDLYSVAAQAWWESLPLSMLEKACLKSDLATLVFATDQVRETEGVLGALALQDPRVPLLVQVPGIGHIIAMFVLAAIGDIARFPSAKQLVGYAGFGVRLHDSGETHWSGRITKQGRRDLRYAMVQAAHNATKHHPKWKHEYERLEHHLGRSKAMVAIARKLLVVVWHVLTKEVADRHAIPVDVARSFFRLAYRGGVRHLPKGEGALTFTRRQLDRLGIGQELTILPWGSKQFKLPPSSLAPPTS